MKDENGIKFKVKKIDYEKNEYTSLVYNNGEVDVYFVNKKPIIGKPYWVCVNNGKSVNKNVTHILNGAMVKVLEAAVEK